MTNSLLKAIPILIASFAVPVHADSFDEELDYVLANGLLSPDVENGILELLEHGSRFEMAIRAIIAEQRVPSWNSGGCGGTGAELLLELPST